MLGMQFCRPPKATSRTWWESLCSCWTKRSYGSVWYFVQPGETFKANKISYNLCTCKLLIHYYIFPTFQLDVTSAQLLVTDNDFRDPEFRKQLNETVKSLLSLKVVPIFNENDAMSTRKAPYEVRFWLLQA